MTPEEILEAKSRLYGGLDGVLEPGERADVIIVGMYQQAVVGTDRRLFVYKAGNKTGSMWRRKVASWGYADIEDLELQLGAKSGYLTVHPLIVDPAIARYGAAGHGSVRQSPNAISFASRPGSAVATHVEMLRGRIAAAKQQGPSETEAAAEEIRKLGELRDAGLLTEEEFAAKKAELLERF